MMDKGTTDPETTGVSKTKNSEVATFAAGCFWGVEETFRRTPGVLDTAVGYTGGAMADPDYRAVCTGATGHAEAVEVEFDPAKVSYADLLEIFWENHDPTTVNRQGPDVGTQYRSAVYFHNEAQRAEALASRERRQASGKHRRPIVTEVTPASAFFRAEEYHQRYLAKRGMPGCHL
ncbi:MAG: methionine-S-sulfoxide reductase [Fibrobacteres bacterium]|nr:methionine-S-sulfoxide reductase [Fibrobacterota bacterium]